MTKAAGDNEKAQLIVQLTSELDTARSTLQEKEKNCHELEQKFHGIEVELNKLKQVGILLIMFSLNTLEVFCLLI